MKARFFLPLALSLACFSSTWAANPKALNEIELDKTTIEQLRPILEKRGCRVLNEINYGEEKGIKKDPKAFRILEVESQCYPQFPDLQSVRFWQYLKKWPGIYTVELIFDTDKNPLIMDKYRELIQKKYGEAIKKDGTRKTYIKDDLVVTVTQVSIVYESVEMKKWEERLMKEQERQEQKENARAEKELLEVL